jgi:D-galactarolactone cycloisomerase
MAATLQLLAVLPHGAGAPRWATPILEYDVGENPIRTDLADPPFQVRQGCVDIPTGPGLGIDVDEAVVRRLAVTA